MVVHRAGHRQLEPERLRAGLRCPSDQALYVSQLAVNPKVTIKLKKSAKAGGGIIAGRDHLRVPRERQPALQGRQVRRGHRPVPAVHREEPQAYQVRISDRATATGRRATSRRPPRSTTRSSSKSKTDAALGKEMIGQGPGRHSATSISSRTSSPRPRITSSSPSRARPRTRFWPTTSARSSSPTRATTRPSSISRWPPRSSPTGPIPTSSSAMST